MMSQYFPYREPSLYSRRSKKLRCFRALSNSIYYYNFGVSEIYVIFLELPECCCFSFKKLIQ